MGRRPARPRTRAAAVAAAGAIAALVLIAQGALVLVAQGAFGAKTDQTQVIGTVNNGTVFDQTVPGALHDDAVKAAEAAAASAIQSSSGMCSSRPRVLSRKKPLNVVQLTSTSCSSRGVLDCNSSGGNGSGESIPTRGCGATTTTFGEG